MRSAFLVFLLALLTISVRSDFSASAGPSNPLLAAAAVEYGRQPENLTVLSEATANYPLTGHVLRVGKIYDSEDDAEYSIALTPSGEVVDEKTIALEEARIRQETYGKLTPQLYEELAKDSGKIGVTIWLLDPLGPVSAPTEDDLRTKTDAQIEKERQDRISARFAEVFLLQEGLVEEVENLGGEIIYRDQAAPMVHANLSADAIRVIAQEPDVYRIDLIPPPASPALDISAPTVHAQYVWLGGFFGSGEKVAIVEKEPLSSANPYLQGRVTNRPGQNCLGSENYHATKVAGVVGSSAGTAIGMAFQANLLGAAACSYDPDDLQDATTWAFGSQGAYVLNNSYGFETEGYGNDVSFWADYNVFNYGLTMTASAGNVYDGEVESPALAYNVIGVGSFNDHNSYQGGTGWQDDSTYSISSYIDPVSTHGDRVKPDIAAPGVSIITTTCCNPWLTPTGATGTSFAAPHVAGAAALIADANSSLRSKPMAMKAILLASAYHAITGDTSDGGYYKERTGAGGLVADSAVTVGYNIRYNHAVVDSGSFGTGCRNYFWSANAGEKVRAAIAWTAYVYDPDYPSDAGADIDLRVYSPSGALVASSTRFDNPHELVEFTAPSTGTYRVCAYKYFFDSPSAYLGVAWLSPATSVCGPQC